MWFGQLPHRRLIQAAVAKMQFPRQAHAAKPGMHTGFAAAGLPVDHPAHHDAPPIGGQRGLGGVEVQAVVDWLNLFAGKGAGPGIPVTQQRDGAVARMKLPVPVGLHLLRADQQQLFAVQREKVGTFPHSAVLVVAGIQLGDKGPVQGVGAFKQQDAALPGLVAVACRAVVFVVLPPDFRVSEIHRAVARRQGRGVQHRVLGDLAEIHAVADCDTLGLQFRMAGGGRLHAGVHQQQLSVRGLHRCAGKASARVGGGIGGEGGGLPGPMQQVGGDSVAPVHGSPRIAVRVILIKQMVFIPIDRKPVGVIYPADRSGDVKGRSLLRRNSVFFFIAVCLI